MQVLLKCNGSKCNKIDDVLNTLILFVGTGAGQQSKSVY
jgi:hypothetical protein